MKNTNIKLNIKNAFVLLAMFAVIISVVPNSANASTYMESPRITRISGYPRSVTTPDYTSTDNTPIVYSSNPSAPKKAVSTPKKSGAVLGASTTKPTDSIAAVGANAINGSNTFLPSGLLGWIVFAILLLIIVILVRKIFGGEKDYHSTPMKHA